MPNVNFKPEMNCAIPVLKRGTKYIMDNIKKRSDSLYDAKVMLGASILLDTCQNVVDYVEIGKNKKLDEKKKNYLQAYKLTNAGVEATVQLAAGSIILNRNVQDSLLKSYQRITGHIPEEGMCIKKNFRVLTVLFGCVVVAKRIIAPLIVTPLTSYIRKKINKN